MLLPRRGGNWILALLLLLVLGAWAGCARSGYVRRRYPARYRRGKLRGVIHTVGKGETLWRIAKTYGLKLSYLARANRIKDPHKLRVGQRLFIPGVKKVLRVPAYRPKALTRKRRRKKTPPRLSARARGSFLGWPVKGRVSSPFGMRWGSKHEGIDIAAAAGTKIKAAAGGKVIYSDNKMRYYGNVVIIKHQGGYFSVYAHNSANLVRAGTVVKQGQVIAKVGQSGRATGPHLHFEIRQGERPINPLLYLPSRW